jgi:sarcosine oxidase
LWISRADDPRTVESRATLEKLGAPFEQLSNAELQRRYPQVRTALGTIGVLEPASGALMARRAVQTIVGEAIRNGCEFIGEAVAPPVGKRRLESIRTNTNRQVKAETFVFACGPWLPKLFPALLGKRIFPTRQEVFFFGIPAGDRRFEPPRMPVWIDFSNDLGPYGFPDLESRGFKLAFDRHGPPFDPDTGSRFLTAEEIALARNYIGERFPALNGAPIIESRVCQYENTSNGDFLIDRHPEFENVWLVGGGSGHGFKHGPAVGQYVTEHILNDGAVDPRFSLATKAETQQRSVY